MLGDPQAAPKGNTMQEQYYDLLRKGPGKEGLLTKLGNIFVPGAVEAVSDTYNEKLRRYGMGAEAERDAEAVKNRARFADMGYYQSDAATARAREKNASAEYIANVKRQQEEYKSFQRLIQGGMKADIQPISEDQIPQYEAQGFVIVRDPVGTILAYRNAQDVQSRQSEAKFEGEIAPTIGAKGEEARKTEGVRGENRLAVEDKRGRNAVTLKQTTPAEAPSSGRKSRAEGVAAQALAQAGDDVGAARKAVMAMPITNEFTAEDLAVALKWLKAKTEDDYSGIFAAFGGGKPKVSPEEMERRKASIGTYVTDSRDGKRKKIIGIKPDGEPEFGKD